MNPPVFDYLLVKAASRCNIDCHYCYWFKDQSVFDLPKQMSPVVAAKLLARVREQIQNFNLTRFSILLHGGEPLLWGKSSFQDFAKSFELLGIETGAQTSLSVTTNGTLIDQEWCDIFRAHSVSVTVSLDGPRILNDKNRVTFSGEGTYDRVVQSLRLLSEANVKLGVLAVADTTAPPDETVRHFADDLKLKHFDVLIPDATHEDNPPSIADYYKRLFDLWLDEYAPRGIGIRLPRGIAVGVLGGDAKLESIGYGPIQTCAVMTDGTLEPLDVLRISGNGSTKTGLNIFDNDLQSVTNNGIWLEAYQASLNLPAKCKTCEYAKSCGGGYLPHRFSVAKRFDNPSVYCADLIKLFDHAWQRVASEVSIRQTNGKCISLSTAVET